MTSKNREEREILESYEDDEWVSVRDRQNEMKRLAAMAGRAGLKDRRINIRLSERDLRRIKEAALREGIPYQTLISSVLHKYGAGMLIEEPRSRRDSSSSF